MAEKHCIKERWRPIPGHDGWYSISDFGRVRRERGGTNTWPGRILVSTRDGAGYRKVVLSHQGDKTKCRIHQIVLLAFLSPCPAGMQTNHKDGDKTNNRLNNLEYLTPKQNTRHAREVLGIDHRRFGETHGRSKLTNDQVQQIRSMCKSGEYRQRRIAQLFGVSEACVSMLVRRLSWSHLPDETRST